MVIFMPSPRSAGFTSGTKVARRAGSGRTHGPEPGLAAGLAACGVALGFSLTLRQEAGPAADDQDLGGAEARDPGAPAVDDVAALTGGEERRHLAFLLIRVGAVDDLDRVVFEGHVIRGHGMTV